MYRFLCSLVVVFSVLALVKGQVCNPATCLLPDCLCSSTDPPVNLPLAEIPQFVHLTFDDAVTPTNILFYREAFTNRYNHDGCPVASTFYVSHEYTFYDRVHELYKQGHEIALHSITHKTDTEYWRTLSVEGNRREFADQRIMMSHFANISFDEIQGIRLPFLQTSGDTTFLMMQDENITYDCSMPTRFVAPGMWPHTLHYESTMDCIIGPCPTSIIPGPWVFPMISWMDIDGSFCSMVDGCHAQPQTIETIYEWMIENFNRTYLSNKAPWGFYVHSAWFSGNTLRFEAFLKFIDYLQTLDDVFITGQKAALDWIRHPVPLSEMTTGWNNCRQRAPQDCLVSSCDAPHGSETRWFSVCGECPPIYPWLDNIFGLA